jgi:hypothetical protein
MQNGNTLVPSIECRQNGLYDFAISVRNLVSRLFGCWHNELSRPFTFEGESYRMCLRCGARRRFVPATWTSVGTYYRKPAGAPTMARPGRPSVSRRAVELEAPMSPQHSALLAGRAFYEITQFP